MYLIITLNLAGPYILQVRVFDMILMSSMTEGTTNTTQVLVILMAALNVVNMPAASILLFTCLQAIYLLNKYVMALFGSCWVVVLAFFIFNSAKGISQWLDISSSMWCFVLEPCGAWGYIATAIYNTLTYLSILWKLTLFTVVDRC
jgi:hypothetical protein